MIFSDTVNKQGLVQDVNGLLGLSTDDTSTYNINDKTRNINEWYRRVNNWIWDSTPDWDFNDSNATTFAIATTTLNHEQQDYQLPSTARTIKRVEVKDSKGDYRLVRAIDKTQIKVALSEYMKTPGLPLQYDAKARSIFLYPKPDENQVTTDKGLRIHFERSVDVFSPSDTDKVPGFDSDFHRILSIGAALDWAQINMPDKVPYLKNLKDEMVREMRSFYAKRHPNFKTKLRRKGFRKI